MCISSSDKVLTSGLYPCTTYQHNQRYSAEIIMLNHFINSCLVCILVSNHALSFSLLFFKMISWMPNGRIMHVQNHGQQQYIYHNFPFLIQFYSFIKVYSCLLIELAYYKPAMYGSKFLKPCAYSNFAVPLLHRDPLSLAPPPTVFLSPEWHHLLRNSISKKFSQSHIFIYTISLVGKLGCLF
ncbi:hypothetical protein HOLleu_16428 [Holothuria leucospilota]|uniref:Uncharacterized protein n=1 Tax=Holothuria leucospilota TaxID=206669 RepID=A0A9Q1C610_HOLLE|nr:hypothetical protein HOLleu_16428 [Holothuria leucospilota]